jgi:hypothetical protein
VTHRPETGEQVLARIRARNPDYKARVSGDERPSVRRSNSGEGPAPEFINAEELNTMRFDPIKYVVPGYIVEGLTLFAGKPKIGKSWLLLHAGVAVARGGFTLGEVKCIEGDVLYCALEDNKRRLQSRMTKLLGTQPWPARLHFVCEMPRLNAGGMDYLRQWITTAKQPRLVIIDTLAMVKKPSPNRNQSMYDADYESVMELRTLANQYGVAIVLVHHLRKQESDDAFDTISGTLGLTGAPDTVMLIKRESRGFMLHARGRDLMEIEKAVMFNADACTWTVLGDAGEVRRSHERTLILAALSDAKDEPLSPRAIATECQLKDGNVRKLLTKMVIAGEVQRLKYGKYTCLIGWQNKESSHDR